MGDNLEKKLNALKLELAKKGFEDFHRIEDCSINNSGTELTLENGESKLFGYAVRINRGEYLAHNEYAYGDCEVYSSNGDYQFKVKRDRHEAVSREYGS